jgi:hypothetical protein
MVQQQVALPETIKAPVRTYVNPDTGSKVTLFGLVHNAQEPYFARVREMAAALQDAGAAVFLELITSPDEQEPTTEQERWGVGVIKRRLDRLRIEAQALGVANQRDALPRREGWQIHDVTTLEAARIYGAEALHRIEQETQQVALVLGNFAPDMVRATLLNALTVTLKMATDAHTYDTLMPEHERNLSSIREQRVLSAFDQQRAAEPALHLVWLWGAGHMLALDNALTERGYKTEDEQWLTAIDAATLPPLIPEQRA